MMKHYRKLIVGIVGIGILLANRHLGLDLSGQEQMLVDLVVGLLTLVGIERLPNDPQTD